MQISITMKLKFALQIKLPVSDNSRRLFISINPRKGKSEQRLALMESTEYGAGCFLASSQGSTGETSG